MNSGADLLVFFDPSYGEDYVDCVWSFGSHGVGPLGVFDIGLKYQRWGQNPVLI